jgi:hypothetical protein
MERAAGDAIEGKSDMIPTECRVCNFALTRPDTADDQVVVCPRCGYCIAVPPPWNQEPVDELVLTLMVRPGGSIGTFQDEQRSRLRLYLLMALLGIPMSVVLLVWAVQAEETWWRLFLGAGGIFMLSGDLVLWGAFFLGRQWEGRGSLVPRPPDRPRGLYRLGRPICVLQEAPNQAAVAVTVAFEILGAATSLVLAYAAWLAVQQGVGGKIVMLLFLGPLLSVLLLYHGCRLVFFPLRVWLFPEGLARIRGSEVAIQRWDRIESIDVETIGTYTGTHYAFTIHGEHGQQLDFGRGIADLDDRDLERLVAVVRSHPELIHATTSARLDRGETVEFGPLQISLQGIAHAGKMLPWEQVARFQVEFGKLEIRTREESSVWCRVDRDMIPNFPLFQVLAERYITP